MAQVRTRKRSKTFSYIFEAGKTADGKRKVVEKSGYPTKDAAYKAGVAAYNDYLYGNIGITSESISLKDFMPMWFANVVAINVKPSSYGHVARRSARIDVADVDFEAKKITVRRQLLYLRKQGYFLAPLKTESSNRYILIDDFLLGELRS